jgi:hypothetical protein
MTERNANRPLTDAADQPHSTPPNKPPLPLQPVILDLGDPDDEPLGGEPPCMAPLLDDEGRVPDRSPNP